MDRIRQAEQAFHRGDMDLAGRLCLEVLSQEPNNAPATLICGLVAAKKGKPGEAVRLLQRTLELSPRDYVATTWLQTALRLDGRLQDAVKVGEEALTLWPNEVEVLVNLSHAYLATRELEKSAQCLAKAAKLQPKDDAIQRRLGIAYELLGQDQEAADQFRRALDLNPRSEEAYGRLATLLIGHGNFTQAIELCETALKHIPRSAKVYMLYAQALRSVHETEEAHRFLAKAIELDPNIVLSAALWLNEDGEFERAAELFRRSIASRPVQGVAYLGIVKGKKVTGADRDLLDTMERLLNEPKLHPKEKGALYYGLGKAANDTCDYEAAMRWFDAGNEVNHQFYLAGRPYDVAAMEANSTNVQTMLSREFVEENRGLGSDTNVPIFVIGMIRSGTTLLEQILSSHPDVGAAGEQRFWINEAPQVVDLESQTLNTSRFLKAREQYINILRSFQPDSPRVTDKMPMNFYCAGLIHLAFPNARFVHIRRHPIDTALSIWMTDLSKPPEFAHDKANIVAEYRNYQRFMDHWRSVIPCDRLLEIQYEELVADQERVTREVLEFCDLSFDAACLEFHKNKRQVSTPSQWQVRQPIYRSSLDRWRNYEPWLGKFTDLGRT